jgi:hypothetical protein
MDTEDEPNALTTIESGSLQAMETRRGDQAIIVSAIVAAGGDKAMRRFLEFFAVTIDNPNTRAAYFHACRRFFAWCDPRDDIEELADIEPMHVAALSAAWARTSRSRPSSSTSPRSACFSTGSS